MSEGLRKAYKYKLKPTPEQERVMEDVLWQCRRLYNAALEQHITLWKQRGATTSQYVQEAELKDLRASLPEYAAIHSHVLQDVLARLEKTYRDFFRRVQARKAGEKGRPNARISTLSRAQPLQQFHLQGGWQWGAIR